MDNFDFSNGKKAVEMLFVIRAKGTAEDECSFIQKWIESVSDDEAFLPLYWLGQVLIRLKDERATSVLLKSHEMAVLRVNSSEDAQFVVAAAAVSAAQLLLYSSPNRDKAVAFAQQLLERSVKLVPSSVEAWATLAEMYWQENRFLSEFSFRRRHELARMTVHARETAFDLNPLLFENTWRLALHYRMKDKGSQYQLLLDRVRGLDPNTCQQVVEKVGQELLSKSYHSI